jgi:stearoyl-CoA desaturase (delta-9 desaturase)
MSADPATSATAIVSEAKERSSFGAADTSARRPVTAPHSTERRTVAVAPNTTERIHWLGNIPYLALHLACFSAFFVGVTPIAAGVAALLFFLRMFAVTGFYHRYFSHKTFKTSRVFQFIMGVAGTTCVQRGPLWWAAHHRHHHAYSDEIEDIHSPRWLGFWRAHVGWFLTRSGAKTAAHYVRDWSRFRELVLLDRFHAIVPLTLAAALYGLGAYLEKNAPSLGTNGWQMLVWGFVISTVVLYHAVYTINSLSHTYGSRRFETSDDSRNNFWLALLTMGEGWHNNHHHYPSSVRQGFYWWEIDITYYLLFALSRVGLIRDLRPVPAHALEKKRVDRH